MNRIASSRRYWKEMFLCCDGQRQTPENTGDPLAMSSIGGLVPQSL
jgi:hypothetical protein